LTFYHPLTLLIFQLLRSSFLKPKLAPAEKSIRYWPGCRLPFGFEHEVRGMLLNSFTYIFSEISSTLTFQLFWDTLTLTVSASLSLPCLGKVIGLLINCLLIRCFELGTSLPDWEKKSMGLTDSHFRFEISDFSIRNPKSAI